MIQETGDRRQRTEKYAAASPQKKTNEIPTGFHLIPDP
jgi:hypothetical protein